MIFSFDSRVLGVAVVFPAGAMDHCATRIVIGEERVLDAPAREALRRTADA
jgi:hypothetical protein